MAKWGKPSDETIKLFDDILIKLELDRYIGVKLIVNNDQKKVVTIVKLPPHTKFAFGDDLLIIVNEEILDGLPELEQYMYVDELLAGVHFDTENDRLTINQQDVKTHSGFLNKYTYEKYLVMKESIKSLYDQKKENEDQDN